MANEMNEGTSKDINQQKRDEEIKNNDPKPKNPNISNHLGSQKISQDVFGGYNSHRDNIVPYERNSQPEKKSAVENVNPVDINKAIKEEIKRSGVDEALADYPPEISPETKASHTEDIKEELAAEQEKKSMKL